MTPRKHGAKTKAIRRHSNFKEGKSHLPGGDRLIQGCQSLFGDGLNVGVHLYAKLLRGKFIQGAF